MSPESMLEKSIDTVGVRKYREWFDTFIPRVQENLVKYWDEPVGDFMAVGDQILIPGILNGNVFIGLQPPRRSRKRQRRCITTPISPARTSISVFTTGSRNIQAM
jgi:cobaltochelatase CobN